MVEDRELDKYGKGVGYFRCSLHWFKKVYCEIFQTFASRFLSHLQLEIKEIGNAYNQNYHPFSKSQFTSIPLEMIGKESAFLEMSFEQRLECTEEVSYEKMLGKNITSRLEL